MFWILTGIWVTGCICLYGVCTRGDRDVDHSQPYSPGQDLSLNLGLAGSQQASATSLHPHTPSAGVTDPLEATPSFFT